MAALFMLVLVLAVSGSAAGDDDPRLPRLKFRDATSMNGCGSSVGLHNVTSDASDAFQEGLLVGGGGGGGGGGRGLTFFCPDAAWRGLVDHMSKNGCGSFAGLLSATPTAGEVFQRRLVSGGGGLTVFCPDDKAVAAFGPAFRGLAAADRVSVLLYHGVAERYGRDRFRGFEWVAVSTLAEDAATNTLVVRDDGAALELWPSPPSYPNGRVLVTRTVSEEEHLALHVVDGVLQPSTVACAGYLGWLRCSLSLNVPVWAIPVSVVVGAVAMTGVLLAEFQLQAPNVVDGN